jgi:hypothetical protein
MSRQFIMAGKSEIVSSEPAEKWKIGQGPPRRGDAGKAIPFLRRSQSQIPETQGQFSTSILRRSGVRLVHIDPEPTEKVIENLRTIEKIYTIDCSGSKSFMAFGHWPLFHLSLFRTIHLEDRWPEMAIESGFS